MELTLESIIEQLLVGALASLLALSIIFFAFGHIWNVSIMRRFFDTLFGERLTAPDQDEHRELSQPIPVAIDERSEGSRPTSTSAHRVARRSKPEGGGDGHVSFALILLLAILYGLGLIWEMGSHKYSHHDNVEQKRQAFYDVASGKLKSGTASHRLARFVSDYNACQRLPHNESQKEEATSLCHDIAERVTQFFYNAKNVVFQHREYHEELSLLEERINFMLSFRLLSKWFLWELGVVFIIAAIAEVGSRNSPGLWTRWMEQLFGAAKERTLRTQWKKAAINFGEHWVGIAAFHILLLMAGCAGLVWLSNEGCAYSEDQFAKRVFGYYLALESEHEGVQENGEGKHVGEAVDLTPESPYHVFSIMEEGESAERGEGSHPHDGPPPGPQAIGREKDAQSIYGLIGARETEESSKVLATGQVSEKDHGPHKQRRFEPAAVQILGNTSQVLVVSDQGGDEPFWLFTLNEEATRMEHPRALHVVRDQDRLQLRSAGTIESLAVIEVDGRESPLPQLDGCSAQGEEKAFRVFAGPQLFGSGSGQLLSFCLKLDPSRQDRESPEIDKIEPLEVVSPCTAVLGADLKACAVEGIALRMNGQKRPELLLGVQQSVNKSRAVIVRMLWQNGAWTHPEQIFPAPDQRCPVDSSIEALKDAGGISDLATGPSDHIYVTTSVQGDSADGKKELTTGPQVGGTLWSLDLGCKTDRPGDPCHCAAQKAVLLETFIHKPDGVSQDNGSVLVVFDDEAQRKSSQWAPRTFALAQDESVFAIVASPDESK